MGARVLLGLGKPVTRGDSVVEVCLFHSYTLDYQKNKGLASEDQTSGEISPETKPPKP